MPWLLGWEGVSSDPEVRKAFEVALHAGTAAALVVILRDEVIEAAGNASLDSAAVVALSLLPPVIVGFFLFRIVSLNRDDILFHGHANATILFVRQNCRPLQSLPQHVAISLDGRGGRGRDNSRIFGETAIN